MFVVYITLLYNSFPLRHRKLSTLSFTKSIIKIRHECARGLLCLGCCVRGIWDAIFILFYHEMRRTWNKNYQINWSIWQNRTKKEIRSKCVVSLSILFFLCWNHKTKKCATFSSLLSFVRMSKNNWCFWNGALMIY